MKKLLPIAVLLLFSSCRKNQYHCWCYWEDNGTKSYPLYIEASLYKAKKACNIRSEQFARDNAGYCKLRDYEQL